MNRICVVTSKSRTYYALVSRLRRAELPFESLLPDSDFEGCELVLTSAEEESVFGGRALALENLDDNPGVFKGQVVSWFSGGKDVVLVGIDPGKRIGLAVFYGRTKLAFSTFDSTVALCSRIGTFARRVPAGRFLVRIGNGNRGMASKLVYQIGREVPSAVIEVVDESGTSARSPRMKGVQGDAVAAARIAFRRGELVSHGDSRSRG